MTEIVIGLGYGDEGKGRLVDYLCQKNPNSLVIRFNGGQQAGHTVVRGTYSHIFSSFGSGTLQGCHTFWSKNCTFYPTFFLNEFKALREVGIIPVLYIAEDAMLTTPYEILMNQLSENLKGKAAHGSCGKGIGTTIGRHTDRHFPIFVRDMLSPVVLKQKMESLFDYLYEDTRWGEYFTCSQIDPFLSACEECIKYISIVNEEQFFRDKTYPSYIFEGGQGIMIDQHHGIFPYVTRSSTTSKEAIKMIETYGLPQPTINYVTRCYQTRHGNGPMTSTEDVELSSPNPYETNRYNEWQGNFRTKKLDLDALRYAVHCDKMYSWRYDNRLVVTCLDQLQDHQVPCIFDGKSTELSLKDIQKYVLPNSSMLVSYSANSEQPMIELKI